VKQTEVDFELTNGAWAAAISPYLINDLPPDLCALTHPVNFSCGRKQEYPEKTHDFRQSVDFFTLFTWGLGSSHIEKSSLRLEPATSIYLPGTITFSHLAVKKWSLAWATREQWRQLSTPFPRHIVRQFQSLYTPSPRGLIATPCDWSHIYA
jgi:hypothetical protein